MTMRPCPQCRRHIAIDESVCPFCAAVQHAAPPTTSVYGRFSRAAVFAGVAGCYTSSQPQQGPPPPPPPSDQQQQEPPADRQFATPPTATGTIRGRLTDLNGAPLANIRVSTTLGSGVQAATITDADGRYSFPNLEPGTYLVSFGVQNNPRLPLPHRQVKLADGASEQVDMKIDTSTPRYDPSNIAKPYGAPPARKRIV